MLKYLFSCFFLALLLIFITLGCNKFVSEGDIEKREERQTECFVKFSIRFRFYGFTMQFKRGCGKIQKEKKLKI